MLNDTHFTVLAGNPSKWDAETRERCRAGRYPGTFNSEDLCRVQVDQHLRGRRSATLWETVYGWAVGYDSNLQNRAVIRGGRREPGLTRDQAIEAGIQWANEDPTNREFYARNDMLSPAT